MAHEQRLGKRIIVIGSSNAGKSTLGIRLAKHLQAPFIELDALFWEPGWVAATDEVFRERVRRAIESDSWVMAGNYSRQRDISWPLADTIVWLDLSLPILLRRCTIRSWQRWRSGELLWGTNREQFWEHLMLWNSDRSLIAFTTRYYWSKRRELEALTRDPRWRHLRFIRLRTQAEIDRWLNDVMAEPLAVDAYQRAGLKPPR